MPAATDAAPPRPDSEDDERNHHIGHCSLTQSEWATCPDARLLLGHAVSRIPVQHLSLVLSELAESVWHTFHEEHPDDWRPTWAIATLRAWCFGEATVEEVFDAREAAMAATRFRPGRTNLDACSARPAVRASRYVHVVSLDDRSSPAAEVVLDDVIFATPNPLGVAIHAAFTLAMRSSAPVARGYADFGTFDGEGDVALRDHFRNWYARIADQL